MKCPYVNELEPNKVITAGFLVQSKEIRQKKSGELYLSLMLSDRTGEVEDGVDAVERAPSNRRELLAGRVLRLRKGPHRAEPLPALVARRALRACARDWNVERSADDHGAVGRRILVGHARARDVDEAVAPEVDGHGLARDRFGPGAGLEILDLEIPGGLRGRLLLELAQRLERLVNWYQTVGGIGRLQPPAEEPPLRAELFSVNQLEHHAKILAGLHALAAGDAPDRLIPRLEENERILTSTYDQLTVALKEDRRIVPAAEWLLDNFHIIEEQILTARRHFPPSYSKDLPRLANGPTAGYPRVYSIAMELISHVDAQIDEGPLRSFIASYQTVGSLKLGELWAIPIMLRLGLIENLQRVTTRLTIARADRDLADLWVDRLQDMAEKQPSRLVIVVADMAKSDLPVSTSFVAEFCQRLSRQSPVLHWRATGSSSKL